MPNMQHQLLVRLTTLCQRSLDPFYIVSCCMKGVKTSWTYSVMSPCCSTSGIAPEEEPGHGHRGELLPGHAQRVHHAPPAPNLANLQIQTIIRDCSWIFRNFKVKFMLKLFKILVKFDFLVRKLFSGSLGNDYIEICLMLELFFILNIYIYWTDLKYYNNFLLQKHYW